MPRQSRGGYAEYGLHLDENRKGTCQFDVNIELASDTDFASLGYYAGTIGGKGIPLFTGIENGRQLKVSRH